MKYNNVTSYKGYDNMWRFLYRNRSKLPRSPKLPQHAKQCGKKGFMSYKQVCYYFYRLGGRKS